MPLPYFVSMTKLTGSLQNSGLSGVREYVSYILCALNNLAVRFVRLRFDLELLRFYILRNVIN